MAKHIQTPDGVVEFPDSFSNDQISDALRTHYAVKKAADTLHSSTVPAPPPEANDIESFLKKDLAQHPENFQHGGSGQGADRGTLAQFVTHPAFNIIPDSAKQPALDVVLNATGMSPIFQAAGIIAPEKTAQIREGLAKTVQNNVNFFASPMGIASLGLGGAPKVVQSAVALAFAAQAAHDLPEATQSFLEEKDTAKKVEKAGNIATQLMMLGGGAAHVFGSAKGMIPKAVEKAGLPATANALKEVNLENEEKANEQQQKETGKTPAPASADAKLATGQAEPKGTPSGETPSVDANRGTAGGNQPAEHVTAAVYTNPSTGVATEGASHAEAAQKQGVTVPEQPEQRETPEYTFKTNTGRTVTREEAARIEGKPEGTKLHSSDIQADTEQVSPSPQTPASTKPADTALAAGGESMGPGAAAAAEIPNAKTTSIKNDQVDVERQKRGEAPLMSEARKANPQTWDAVMAKIERNPDHAKEIVKDINSGKKKDINDEDQLAVLHEQIRLRNERDMEADRINDPNATDADRVEAKTRFAAHEEALNAAEEAGRKAGTEAGRALQIRQMMVRDDYTVASLERKMRAAKGGKPLTPEESATIKAQAEKIAELEKKFSERQAGTKQRGSDEAINTEHKELTKQARGKKASQSDVDRITTGIQKAVAKGRKLTDLSGFINKLSLALVKSGIKEREPLVDSVHAFLKTIDPNITRRDTMDAISGYGDFKQLSKDEIKVKLRDLKGQMQQVAKIEDLQKKIPPRKTGGERRIPSDTERKLIKEVNELKKKGGFTVTDPETQLKSALDSIKTRIKNQIKDLSDQFDTGEKPVKKDGVAYDKEAEKLKATLDNVRQTLKDIEGSKGITDEQRIKIANAYLDKSIAAAESDLKSGNIYPESKTNGPPLTPEIAAKKAALQSLRDERQTLRDLDTQMQEFNKESQLESSITELEKKIKSGDVSTKSGKPTVDTVEVSALKQKREALQKQLSDLRNGPKKTKEEIALQSFKTRTENRIKDYNERIEQGDFTARPRRELKLDDEAYKLKVEAEKVKRKFDEMASLERFKNRTPTEKAADFITKWRRAFILSGPVTLAKLTTAAAERMAFTPIEEAVGAGIGKIIPKVAEKATREGGFSVRAEAKALTEGMSHAAKDAWDMLRTGTTDLDAIYGKQHGGVPKDIADVFGHIHGALKVVTKRNEFARSFQKLVEKAIVAGVDVHDPMVQMKLGMESYKEANKSIFMQDNRVVNAYKAGIRILETPDKATGKPTVGGKIGSALAKIALPIVKVPTNIVAETMQYAAGTITGSARLANAFRNGIENLKPEQADLIMRELKKGSIGAAALLVGYLNPKIIGGYYQPGEKRKEGDVKAGGVKMFGVNLPSYVVHNPLLETLQIGATIRRVADSRMSAKSGEKKGLWEGIYAGALGLTSEVPFIRETGELSKAMNPNEKNAFWGELSKSIAVPQLVQWFAQQGDKDSKGNPIVREPKGIPEYIESGIPGLRQKLPEKKKGR